MPVCVSENEILEKFIHKLQYVEPSLCQEFYTRAGVSDAIPLYAAHFQVITNLLKNVTINGYMNVTI